MSSDIKIDYYTEEFNKFKADVLAENMNGAVVLKLTPFGPPIATDFNHRNVMEKDFHKMDMLITVTQVNCPAVIVGNTDEGKMFIRLRKYSIMK